IKRLPPSFPIFPTIFAVILCGVYSTLMETLAQFVPTMGVGQFILRLPPYGMALGKSYTPTASARPIRQTHKRVGTFAFLTSKTCAVFITICMTVPQSFWNAKKQNSQGSFNPVELNISRAPMLRIRTNVISPNPLRNRGRKITKMEPIGWANNQPFLYISIQLTAQTLTDTVAIPTPVDHGNMHQIEQRAPLHRLTPA